MKPSFHQPTIRRHFGYFFILLLVLCLTWACAKGPVGPGRVPTAPEDRMYANAQKLFKAGDNEDALAQYQAYVAQYPHRAFAADALMKIAAIHTIGERYRAAREVYRRILKEYPKSISAANARVELLATYYQQGDFSGFFKHMTSVNVDSLPRSSRLRLYKLMGDAYMAQNKPKEAVDAYAHSLSYYVKPATVESLPEMVSAIKALTPQDIRELLSGPDYLPKAYLMYSLGNNNLRMGHEQAALKAFRAFLAAYPNNTLSATARGYVNDLEQKTKYDHYAIGCILPLTGPYSRYGNRALDGVELAISQFRLNHPEVPIKLLIKDTGSNESRTRQAVRELNDAKVAAIIGPIVMAVPAAEEAQRFKIPIITLTQKEGITDIGDYVFRNFLTPQTQVDTLVSYLAGTLGLKRFAILYPDEKYGKTFMNLFWDQVLAHGGTVMGCESYNDKATDFADPIKRLVGLYYPMPDDLKLELANAAKPLPKAVRNMMTPDVLQKGFTDFVLPEIDQPSDETDQPSDGTDQSSVGINVFNTGGETSDLLSGEGDYEPDKNTEPKSIVDFDAVFIPDSPQKAGLIVPQLAYYDVDNVYFVGTNLWHSNKLIQMARRYVQRSILTDGFFADSARSVVKQFVASFTSAYGRRPGFIEAVAYDTADILFGIVSRPDVSFRSTIRDTLVSASAFQGVTGPTTFLESGEAQKQLYLLQIQGNKFQAVPQAQRTASRP